MNSDVQAFWEKKREKIKKEIEETGKYPRSFQNLPAYFNVGTDNYQILETDNDPTEIVDGMLTIKPHLLGINKKSKGFTKVIEWGAIYIVGAKGTCLYKIGITDNFNRRFRDLSAASPLPLFVIKYAQCDNPQLIENVLHDKFASKSVKNEWFQLEGDELFEAMAFIDKYYNL